MSKRLFLINLYLRRFVRPALARMTEPEKARHHLERSAAMIPGVPRAARYLPESVPGPAGPVPVEWVSCGRAGRRRIILYLHGGAYLMGSPRTHRSITAHLARLTGMRVMVPDYRLAPEHPAPAAVEDCLAAYATLLAQGYDPRDIAFAGESAGGGLCFALLLLARAKGYPAPGCIVAFSPWVDLAHTGDSIAENAKAEAMLPAERVDEVAAFYIGAGDARDPLISPLYGKYASPPPTYIAASKAEILRDDAIRMAEHLRAGGGEVTLDMTADAPHAWQFFGTVVPEARVSLEAAARFVKTHLGAASIRPAR
jgi:acetyl esterase/lipase